MGVGTARAVAHWSHAELLDSFWGLYTGTGREPPSSWRGLGVADALDLSKVPRCPKFDACGGRV